MFRPSYLLAATALAACAEPLSPEPAQPTDAGIAALAVSRPAGGTCELVSRTLLPPVEGQPANVRHLQLAYDCRLLHLGRTTATGTRRRWRSARRWRSRAGSEPRRAADRQL